MRPRIMVAGVGNMFNSDDGFGLEVVRRLADVDLGPEVHLEDFGIRGVHLAYELLEGYEVAILVDALSRGDVPGTVYLFEPDPDGPDAAPPDAHTMHPRAVIDYLRALDGPPVRFLVVGCEPATLEEGIGLSEPVMRAVDDAVALVRDVVRREVRQTAATTST